MFIFQPWSSFFALKLGDGEEESLSHRYIWAPLRLEHGGCSRNGAGGCRAAESKVAVVSGGDGGRGFFSRGDGPPRERGKGRKEAEINKKSV